MTDDNTLNHKEMWRVIIDFMGSSDFVSENDIDLSKPMSSSTAEFNKFILALVEKCEKPEIASKPERVSEILTAACTVIPYSFILRQHAETFCEQYSNTTSETLKAVAHRKRNLKTNNYRIALSEILAEIENYHPKLIETAKFKGIHYWPMLRATLATEVENRILAKARFATRIAGDAEAALYRIDNAFSNDVRYTAPIIEFLEKDPGFQQGNMDVEFLFFARALRYMKKKNGYWVDGPFEYLHQILSQNYSCLKIEEYDDKALKRQPRVLPAKYFETPWQHDQNKYLNRMKGKISPWTGPEEKAAWRLYSSACRKLDLPGDKKLYHSLLNRMKFAEGYAQFFKELIGRISPKFVFQEFYYSPESIGLMLACNSLGIPVIEVQHGLVGTHQWLSTHWTHMPENGYFNHPDCFWVFDKFEKKNTEQHLPKNGYHRPAVVGGLSELQIHLQQDKTPETVNPHHEMFLSTLDDGKYNILYSLQYDDVDFSGIIAMSQNCAEDVRILLRLHPMQAPLIEGIQEIISSYGLDNIEVEYSTRVPVYTLLPKCHHVVTKYSTLAREGLEFDLDVTLIDSMGGQLFCDYVELGRMNHCNTNKELVATLQDSYRTFKNKPEWQAQLKGFAEFRKEHLQISIAETIAELRSDWESKREYRARKSELVLETKLFTDPVDISQSVVGDVVRSVDRSGPDYQKRFVFVVHDDIPVNRNSLTAVFAYAHSLLEDDVAVDFVFSGEKFQDHEMEILGLYYGMTDRPSNVHIDHTPVARSAALHKNATTIDKKVLEALDADLVANQPNAELPKVIPSSDIVAQTRNWLQSKDFSKQTIAVTLSDALNDQEVRDILNSGQLKDLGERYQVIINGSRHFRESEVECPEAVLVFEPGTYLFDAAVALIHCTDSNILISERPWEKILSNNQNNLHQTNYKGWMSGNSDELVEVCKPNVH